MFNCSDAKFRAIPQKVASIYTYEFVTLNSPDFIRLPSETFNKTRSLMRFYKH